MALTAEAVDAILVADDMLGEFHMATTPEGAVKYRVKVLLKKLQAYWHMPVQNGMGSPSLDFHVCLPVLITQDMVGKTMGMYVGIETKAPGNVPTARQLTTMAEIRRAHGHALVIEDNTDAIENIAKYGYIHGNQ
ncbi:MAG: hypothetical protein ACHQ9S_18980 [Candidatus Binatia bacterium]